MSKLHRDIASHDLWAESLERSRARRAAAAAQGPDLVPRGSAVAAAALVLTGGSVAGMVGHTVFGGGPDNAQAALDASREAASVKPQVGSVPDAPAAATETASTAPARPAVRTTTSTPTAKPAKPNGVTGLQAALSVPPDGDFGPATQRALKRWQGKHGLPADGVAGPTTRKALGLGAGPPLKRVKPAKRSRRAAPARARVASARRGRRGGGVTALQRVLGLSADGVFGPGTERALKRWQRSHGMTADGVAGPQTRRALGLRDGRVLKRRGGRRGGGRRGGGGGSSVVARVIAAGSRIATKPYRYGGGHGSFTDSGYDCSGSVSYALHGGGLLSSPLDSRGFMSYGRSGPGRHISIYANPGHVYLVVDGRRFDTSARSDSGSRWSGRRRASGGYTVRHPAGL